MLHLTVVMILLHGPVLRQLGHRVVPHQRLHLLLPSDLVMGHEELLDQRRSRVLGEVVRVWFQRGGQVIEKAIRGVGNVVDSLANVVGGIGYFL